MQRIGIAGIGKISGIYLDNLTGMFNGQLQLTVVTDVFAGRVNKAADNYHVRAFPSIDVMAESPDVDIVLNLTRPRFHFDVALAAVYVKRSRAKERPEVPLLKNHPENSRGLGVAGIALTIEENRPHNASAERVFHVNDIMRGIHNTSTSGKYYKLKSKYKRPVPLE